MWFNSFVDSFKEHFRMFILFGTGNSEHYFNVSQNYTKLNKRNLIGLCNYTPVVLSPKMIYCKFMLK